MKGRPNIYQNEELILKAQELFWQKGYYATSLAELSSVTGAGAGSLYNNFKGGKKELFKRALQKRRKDLNIFKELLLNSEDPINEIKQFFLNIANSNEVAHQKGCIIANTLVEMSFLDEELKNEANTILKETEELYKNVISNAQENGKIQTKIPADALAKYLITFWCGINSLRRMYPDNKILKTQINLQLDILS